MDILQIWHKIEVGIQVSGRIPSNKMINEDQSNIHHSRLSNLQLKNLVLFIYGISTEFR